jgi:hypothetical protein
MMGSHSLTVCLTPQTLVAIFGASFTRDVHERQVFRACALAGRPCFQDCGCEWITAQESVDVHMHDNRCNIASLQPSRGSDKECDRDCDDPAATLVDTSVDTSAATLVDTSVHAARINLQTLGQVAEHKHQVAEHKHQDASRMPAAGHGHGDAHQEQINGMGAEADALWRVGVTRLNGTAADTCSTEKRLPSNNEDPNTCTMTSDNQDPNTCTRVHEPQEIERVAKLASSPQPTTEELCMAPLPHSKHHCHVAPLPHSKLLRPRDDNSRDETESNHARRTHSSQIQRVESLQSDGDDSGSDAPCGYTSCLVKASGIAIITATTGSHGSRTRKHAEHTSVGGASASASAAGVMCNAQGREQVHEQIPWLGGEETSKSSSDAGKCVQGLARIFNADAKFQPSMDSKEDQAANYSGPQSQHDHVALEDMPQAKAQSAATRHTSSMATACILSERRCCGRLFLRRSDLLKHWETHHTSGVQVCTNGYRYV